MEARDSWEQRYYEKHPRPEPDAQDAREKAFREAHSGGDNLLIGAVIAAVMLPIVGIVLGIVLLLKDRVGPGLGVILLSVLSAVVAYALFIA